MNPSPTAPSPAMSMLRSAGWGGKALLVFLLALLMSVPGLFVYGLVAEREHRANGVMAEVSNLRGGPQTLVGPLLIAPWSAPSSDGKSVVNGWYIVSPREGSVDLTVKSSTLHRGIFDVPVYDAGARIKASFDPPPLSVAAPGGGRIDWSRAVFVLAFTDLRGARQDVAANFNAGAGGAVLEFIPTSTMDIGGPAANGPDGQPVSASFGLVTASAAPFIAAGKGGVLTASLEFTGAQRLAVAPFARSTRVNAASAWTSPSFDGAFLPRDRAVGKAGFTAAWSVPFLARGLSDQGTSQALSLNALNAKAVGVTFAVANNPYASVERALKYGVMFIGLVFLTFFVFEALSGQRVHAAQYVLIGLAQMIFYLLLLSLSEYVGFDIAFAGAAMATVGLISLYAGWALGSRTYRLRALIVFSLLYALIYALMRLEDFALLAGSLASFIGLAAAMYLTRNLNWYAATRPSAAPTPTA